MKSKEEAPFRYAMANINEIGQELHRLADLLETGADAVESSTAPRLSDDLRGLATWLFVEADEACSAWSGIPSNRPGVPA